MEQEFKKRSLRCLSPVVREPEGQEQTLELRLPDGMPDIGQVLCAWGQPVLRGKEWESRSVSVAAGAMVWVLWAPEDGSQPRCLDGWIPFSLSWDLPENTPEGALEVDLKLRFVDARSVSPRKLMVRCGITAFPRALAEQEHILFEPGELPGPVCLKRETYPLRLLREAGERSFPLQETLTFPASAPQPEKLLCYTLSPEVTDARVLTSRVVFRGNGRLHVFYRGQEGELAAWEFPLPFSQYAQLEGVFPDGAARVLPVVTGLELTLDDEGALLLKAEITAQYAVEGLEAVTLVTDAYCPSRELTPQWGSLAIPALLETRRENLKGEEPLPRDAQLLDCQMLPGVPRVQAGEGGVTLELPGHTQLLYRDAEGTLRGSSQRWTLKKELPADQGVSLEALPGFPSGPQTIPGREGERLSWELPLDITAAGAAPMEILTGLTLGAPQPGDPNRPSLILRRPGDQSLWDLAKAAGSTVEAIRSANGLTGEPEPGRLLIIPVTA